MCVCVSLCGWASVGVRVGGCACDVCACVCVHGLVQRLGVDSNILLVGRCFLSGSIVSVPMANERIWDLVLPFGFRHDVPIG